MIITAEMLEAKGACGGQLNLFRRLFPNGSPKTHRAARAAAIRHAAKFDWNWAADNLLPFSAWSDYDIAGIFTWRAYCVALAPASKVYREASRPVVCASRETIDSVLHTQAEVTADAQRAYREAEETAYRVYKEMLASAFVDALFRKVDR